MGAGSSSLVGREFSLFCNKCRLLPALGARPLLAPHVLAHVIFSAVLLGADTVFIQLAEPQSEGQSQL